MQRAASRHLPYLQLKPRDLVDVQARLPAVPQPRATTDIVAMDPRLAAGRPPQGRPMMVVPIQQRRALRLRLQRLS